MKTFSDYEIIEEIGKGGFATVYRARDRDLDREVALKILDPLLMRDPVWVKRFKREARAVASFKHPHIVSIYEIGQAEGVLYIAMELAQGGNLEDRIQQLGRLSWEETLRLVGEMASALDYAHGKGVLHRDLKPANVLLDADIGSMLTDFGFVRILADNSMSVSLSGGVVGTPAYIAPEVWKGEPATAQADIYALGCVIYEMLTGQQRFTGPTSPAVMMAHFNPPPLPAEWSEDVPPGVNEVLARAMAQEPEKRYATAGELAEDLAALSLDQLVAPYAALVEAVAAGQWQRALALVDEIKSVDPDYRDVTGLEREALKGIQHEAQEAQASQWKEAAQQAFDAGDLDAAEVALAQWLLLLPGDKRALAMKSKIEAMRSGEVADEIEEEESGGTGAVVGAAALGGAIATSRQPLPESPLPHMGHGDASGAPPPNQSFSATRRPAPPPKQPDEKENRTKTVWAGIAIVLLLFIVGAFFTLLRSKTTPTPVAIVITVEKTILVTPTPADIADPASSMSQSNSPTATPTATPTPLPTATPTYTPTPRPTKTPTPVPPYAKVSKVVNVRKGPGTVYPKLGKTEPGAQYVVLGRNKDGSWYQIQFGDKKGWIAASLVNLQGSDQSINAIAEVKSIPPTPKAPVYGAARGRIVYAEHVPLSNTYKLYLINADGTGKTLLKDNASEPSFTSDGRSVVYYDWSSGISRINVDGTNDHSLYNARNSAFPSISPDGTKLAYMTWDLTWGWDVNSNFWWNISPWIEIRNADGSGQYHRVADGDAPDWAPDSTRLVYKGCVNNGTNCGIMVVNIATGERRRLTDNPDDGNPTWSPDGRYIAFSRKVDESNIEIFVMNSNGSNQRRLTYNPTSDGMPAWFPDSRHLAFRSDRDGAWAIYTMNLDGSGVRKVTYAHMHPHWTWERMDVTR